MNQAYLLIGGNMGQIKSNLGAARKAIEAQIGSIEAVSSLYKTAAWGLEDQPDFLNQVIYLVSDLAATDMLAAMLQIEQQLGRVREIKNGPRIIDIDLLYFNDEIIDLPDLKVPHPLLHTRRFTLEPLAELAPDFIHPVLHKSTMQLLIECPDRLNVEKLPPDTKKTNIRGHN